MQKHNNLLERRVQKRNTDMKESEERFRRLINHLPTVVYISKPDDANSMHYVSPQWDALTSDRPYRAAWPKEKAREHILAASGDTF